MGLSTTFTLDVMSEEMAFELKIDTKELDQKIFWMDLELRLVNLKRYMNWQIDFMAKYGVFSKMSIETWRREMRMANQLGFKGCDNGTEFNSYFAPFNPLMHFHLTSVMA